MTISNRETALLLMTLGVALFGGTTVLLRPKIDEWKQLRLQQQNDLADIQTARDLLASRSEWEKRFQALSQELPVFPPSVKMDIHWLSIMDQLAAKNGVRIIRRQAGEEKRVGDVYELPIECRDWEASLSGLLHFLFDLQKQAGMMDIRYLYIKPAKNGMLRGRFTLYCAYTRQPQPGGKP